jgi:hypothetical protein
MKEGDARGANGDRRGSGRKSAPGGTGGALPESATWSEELLELLKNRDQVSAITQEMAFRMGREILKLSSGRRTLVRGLLRDLSGLSGTSEEEFLLESVGALVLQVGDLPASERFHHRERFGLLDHSLEVAGGMLRRMREGVSREGTRVAPVPRDGALWARGALGMGLYHDLGKVFDIRVPDPRTGVEWNPVEEPLAFFKRRAGLPFLSPTPFEYRRGRGVERHEGRSLSLLAGLLPVPRGDPLRKFLTRAMTAYAGRRWCPPKGSLGYLVALTSAMDVESQGAQYRKRVRPGGGP